MNKREELDRLLAEGFELIRTMPADQLDAMREAQRQSWLRAMAPCEHGVRDWETCPACRAKATQEPVNE